MFDVVELSDLSDAKRQQVSGGTPKSSKHTHGPKDGHTHTDRLFLY